jgi:hypothetical protein
MALVAYLQAATAERRLGSDRWMPSSRWPDGSGLWVPDIRVTSCDLRILMDQPTKVISSYDGRSRPDGRWLRRPERWGLPQGAVRAVKVVMVGVLGQHRSQLPTAEDEHPVQHLTPNGADPPLRVGVRPRCPHRRVQHLDPLGGKDRIEGGGELGIPIAKHKPEPTDILLKVHHQVSGLLCCPLPHRMRRHPEHTDPAGRHLDREQDVHPLRKTVSTVKKSRARTLAA